MKIDIMTLFPETVDAVLHESIIGRAAKRGIVEITCHQIRDYTENRQKQVDDYPYGGGRGCVMMAQPLKSCLDDILKDDEGRTRVIYMSPQGQPFTQETAKRLKNDYDRLVLVCGHYEGIDERFIERCVDEEISIGDFVLTGGEIAAMAVADSVCRLVPGVLSDEECYTGESHWDGLLEYPQYTRPEVWEGLEVPEVLLKGDHEKVDEWRYRQQLIRTRDKRPDMFDRLNLSDEQKKALKSLKGEVKLEKAAPDDLEDICNIVRQAKALLKGRKIDQWQGPYPTREDYINDINKGECFIIRVNGKTEAVFVLTCDHQENYDEITDGKWFADMPYCSLHRCAVSDDFRNTGLADRMMSYVDAVCRELGMRCIRVDTHKKNKAMQRLLTENGYRYRGNVLVSSEPGHDPARHAYEKVLKK